MSQNQTKLPVVIQNAISTQKIDLSEVNLLLPTQSFGQVLGEYDKVTIEVIRIDPDPKNGDVYEISRGKLVPAKRPLEAISDALGIVWDPKTTGIVESTSRKSRAKATGAMRRPNGEWVIRSDEKTVDLDAIEEEQRIKYEKEAEKGRPYWDNGQKSYTKWKSSEEKKKWIYQQIRESMLSYRKFKDERALTGAEERVIRKFVALKNFYTPAELSKPLAFPRVIPDTSKMLENPEIRQAAINRMTGTAGSIFGPGMSTERRIPSEEAQYQVIDTDEEKQEIEAPGADQPKEEEPEIPWEGKSPEEEEIEASLKELEKLSEIPYLPRKGKAEVDELLSAEHPNLDALNELIERITNWLERSDVIQKYGRYKEGSHATG